MAFIVELTSRSGRVLERHRITEDRFSVGRGFDNRIIVADPYVDVHHCVVEAPQHQVEGAGEGETEGEVGSEGGRGRESSWRVIRVPGVTAVHVNGRRLDGTDAALASGDTVVLGRTHLRIFSPDHPVEPVQVFDRVEQFFASLATPQGIFWSVLVFLLVVLADLFFRSWSGLEFAAVLQEVFGTIGLTLGWAAFWAVVARISRGEPRFFHHWLVAAMTAVLGIVGTFLIDVIAFNTASLDARDFLSRLLTGLCLAFALTLNLRFSIRQGIVARHVWAQGVAWAIVGYGILTWMQWESFFAGAPSYEGTVLPEIWRVAPAVSAETFVGEGAGLFDFPQEEAGKEAEGG